MIVSCVIDKYLINAFIIPDNIEEYNILEFDTQNYNFLHLNKSYELFYR